MKNQIVSSKEHFRENKIKNNRSVLGVLVNKEISSHIRSWRLVVLILLIIFTFVASMYVSMSNIKSVVAGNGDSSSNLIYLKFLTASDNAIPPFHVFLNFLAPLLGIALGFDAINTEKNTGTLTRIMAQPIYRDNLLIGKFISPLVLVASFFIALT
ncbi:MAG: ABC transporter permease, partial [Sphingobacterium sp.]